MSFLTVCTGTSLVRSPPKVRFMAIIVVGQSLSFGLIDNTWGLCYYNFIKTNYYFPGSESILHALLILLLQSMQAALYENCYDV